jgi:hypothetical protein
MLVVEEVVANTTKRVMIALLLANLITARVAVSKEVILHSTKAAADIIVDLLKCFLEYCYYSIATIREKIANYIPD